MTYTTCKVWECMNPLHKSSYSSFCKQHKESNQHNGHPTFKAPTLSPSNTHYDKEIRASYKAGRRWFDEAELTTFKTRFERLLDRAEAVEPLSPYRRLGDLPVERQLLYLLNRALTKHSREEIQKRLLCLYLAAFHRQGLFPNRKTFAVFVIRKGFTGLISLPKHITSNGNHRYYRLNANRAVSMLNILEPIFELAFIAPPNMSLWYHYQIRSLSLFDSRKQGSKTRQLKDPDFAKSMVNKRIIKSINNRYLGGL